MVSPLRTARATGIRRSRVPAFACPVCNEPAVVSSRDVMSRLTVKYRYFCNNHDCGHTFTTFMEFGETISPSALGPVDRTAPLLRLKSLPRPPIGAPPTEPQPPPD